MLFRSVTGAPLYIVHLSAAQALDRVTQARDTGQNVFAETCPQYLYLSLEDLARPDFEGAKYVCSPPLRMREHQDSLWRGLRGNDLSVVSTDHCPFCFKDQKELGRNDFARIVVPTRLFTSSETSFAPIPPNARLWRSKYAYV